VKTQSRLTEQLVAGLPLLSAAVVLAVFALWLALGFFVSTKGGGPPVPLLPSAVLMCTESDTQPPGLTRSVAFVLTGLVAFVLGNLAGRVRARFASLNNQGTTMYQIAATLFLSATTVALGYETVGTWLTDLDKHSAYWPITSYVRCAINHYPFYAAFPAVVVPFLIGHWLHRRA
jgi:hypothetical protein